MAEPVCPPNYECVFTPHRPPEPKHVFDPWWTGPVGTYVAIAALIALVIVAWVLIYWIADTRKAVARARDSQLSREHEIKRERDRQQHDLNMAEQFTMQLDTAKGDPELTELVKQQQKGRR